MRSRRNTAILGALIVLMILFEAFQAGAPANGADTPVAITNQYRANPVDVLAVIDAPPWLFGCVKYCWFAEQNRSAIVLYSDPNASNQGARSIGWDLVGQYGGKWYQLSAGEGSGSGQTTEGAQLTSLASMSVPISTITYRYGVRSGYVMTLGRADSPDVARVAVRYDTGEVVTQWLNNGAFATFAHAGAACDVSLFDASDTLLQRLDASNDPMLAMEIGRDAPGACQ